MTYDWLFSFAVFADHLNFTKAAAELHISQPALHVQVRKLGEQVGVPLYRREGRDLVLTAEGEQLAAYGREVRESGEGVLARLRGEAAQHPVVLASGQGAFMYLLGAPIQRFDTRALRLLPMPAGEAIEAVRSARAHLAVTVMDQVGDLDSIPLCDVGQQVVVPREHPLASLSAVAPQDLEGLSLVVAPEGSPHRTMLENLLRQSRVDWNVAVEASGWELMLRFARYGVGLAIVNDFCELPLGMVGVPLLGAPTVTYRIVWRRGLQDPGARELRDLIEELVAE